VARQQFTQDERSQSVERTAPCAPPRDRPRQALTQEAAVERLSVELRSSIEGGGTMEHLHRLPPPLSRRNCCDHRQADSKGSAIQNSTHGGPAGISCVVSLDEKEAASPIPRTETGRAGGRRCPAHCRTPTAIPTASRRSWRQGESVTTSSIAAHRAWSSAINQTQLHHARPCP
jgi:hypothetical protein